MTKVAYTAQDIRHINEQFRKLAESQNAIVRKALAIDGVHVQAEVHTGAVVSTDGSGRLLASSQNS